MAKFKHGDFFTCDVPHPGRHKTLTTPEIIDQIRELILEDCRISAKSIAEQLGISCEWVPKCLNANQKRKRYQSSEQLLEFLWRDPNDFLSRLVTMDETWLYHYHPETKQQSWIGGIAAHPTSENSECKKNRWYVLTLIFWDQDGMLLIDYLPKGQTINAEYYSSLLVQLKDIVKENAAGRSRIGSCSCTTMPRFTGHLIPRRNWPACASSVLITHPVLRIWPPSEYHLFSRLKNQLKSRHFSSHAEVIATAETWLDGQPSDFFFILIEWLAKVRATG